jgi:hypothetical protein
MQFRRYWYIITHWEFWPEQILYFPVYMRYAVDVFRFKSPFYFTAVNPGMETGGFVSCSKHKQLCQLPEDNIPFTCFFKHGTRYQEVCSELKIQNLEFPLIVKPDMGERGKDVLLVNNLNELEEAVQIQKSDFLIQQYLDYPFEAGVFVVRLPEKRWRVVSITLKEFLSVRGDGLSTIAALLRNNPRAIVAGEKRVAAMHNHSQVPAQGEVVYVQPIGNHNRGTTFIDGRSLLNEQIEAEAERLASCISGFHYGRFDLRCTSEEDFLQGKNWKVLEINGASAEPAHIYQPGFSLSEAWRTVSLHWKWIAEIAKYNMHKGYKPYTYDEFSQAWKLYSRKRTVKSEDRIGLIITS